MEASHCAANFVSHPGYFPDFKKSFCQSCIHIEHLTSCSLCTVTVWRWGYANLTFLWRALRSSFNIADAMMKFKIHEHGGFLREGFHRSEYIIRVQCSSNWEKHHDYSIHPWPHFVVRQFDLINLADEENWPLLRDLSGGGGWCLPPFIPSSELRFGTLILYMMSIIYLLWVYNQSQHVNYELQIMNLITNIYTFLCIYIYI